MLPRRHEHFMVKCRGQKNFSSYNIYHFIFHIWAGWNLERSVIPQKSPVLLQLDIKSDSCTPIFWSNHLPPDTHSGGKEISSRAIKMSSFPLKSASKATLNRLSLERCSCPYIHLVLVLPITDHIRMFSPDSLMVYT